VTAHAVKAHLRLAGNIAIALLLCACARNRISTNVRGVVVRVQPDSVPMVRTPDITKFTVRVIIRNNRSTPVYYAGCSPDAQEEINGKWETVWSPICGSTLSGSIAAGASLAFPFTAAGFPHGNMYPRLDPRAGPGKYRLRLGYAYSEPVNDNIIYSPPRKTNPRILGELISPIFIVYSP
jgi:hypothetical protein